MLKISVSRIDTFKKYQAYEWFTFEKLEEQITKPFIKTEEMDRGTDFHSLIENHKSIEAEDGFFIGELTKAKFDEKRIRDYVIPEMELSEFDLFEESNYKIYNAKEKVCVTGRADILSVNKVIDIKTMNSASFSDTNYEYYHHSMQWKFYLDMFDCDEFLYKIFPTIYDKKTNIVEIMDCIPIEFRRSANLQDELTESLNVAIDLIHEYGWEDYFKSKY